MSSQSKRISYLFIYFIFLWYTPCKVHFEINGNFTIMEGLTVSNNKAADLPQLNHVLSLELLKLFLIHESVTRCSR